MNIFFLISSFFFFLWIIRSTLFWTNLWQTKEYRIDRFVVHFTETAKGKEILFSPLSWFKWFLFIAYIIPIFYDSTLQAYHLAISLVLGIDGFFVVREIITRRLRRPVFTLRAACIVVGALFIIGILYLFPLVDRFLWLLILHKSILLIVFFLVFLLSIPSELVKDYLIEKASKKIQNHKNLLVIGVSGSYGKSSTKEYIAHILGQQFNVAKTDGSNNTPIGVARAILSKIENETEVFVVELGSYKKGEVRELCEIVHPKISVTTSVSDQHLSLYGSFQNILDTEKELIDCLPKDGLALFNGNDKGARELFQKTKKKKFLYRTTELGMPNEENLGIEAYLINVKKDGISFHVTIKNKDVQFESALLGIHNVENILPGIFLGLHLGMSISDLKVTVRTLKPLSKTMVKINHKSGAVFLDDTFNVSPESVKAGLEYMKLYSHKKIVVLEPLIELGENSHINHYKLGLTIGKVCDYLFLTNSNFYSSVMSGIKDSEGKCRVKVASINDITTFINNTVKSGDIILFEGREPNLVQQKLLR